MRSTAICGILCVVASYGQTPGQGSISGAVIDAASNEPIRKAVVILTWQGMPSAWATTRTDGSGKFVFDHLPAGKYSLRATKQEMVPVTYGAGSTRELGDLIRLEDGETVRDIKLRFVRPGSISGRVVDADGDPLPGVPIQLLGPGRNLARSTMNNFRTTMTDDRGEYKIIAADTGEFYLRCVPGNYGFPGRPSADVFLPQYYRGAAESKDAVPLKLRGGEAFAGVDFQMVRRHPAIFSGRVTGVPALDVPETQMNVAMGAPQRFGRNNQFISVVLSPVGEEPGGRQFGSNASAPDYHFEISGPAPPGRYLLEASVTARDKTYFGTQLIDAQEGTNDVTLVLAPAVDVKGRIKFEGPGGQPAHLRVELGGPGHIPGQMRSSSEVAKDGTFTIKDVPPGEWVLSIQPTSEGMFEKSVALGDRSFANGRVEIPPGLNAPLSVVLSSNTATIEGQVEADAAASKRAGILLEPIGERHNLLRFYYATTAEDSGKFTLKGIAPGKYKIYALEKIAPASFRNPESCELLEDLGEDVEISEGARLQLHSKLIPIETARRILKP